MTFNLRNIFDNLFEYIIAFVIIIECRSQWLFFSNTSFHFEIKFLIILIGCVVLNLMISRSLNKPFGRYFFMFLVVFSVFAIYILVYSLFQNIGRNNLLRYFIAISLFLLYYYLKKPSKDGYPTLFDKISNVTIFIAICSIALWFLICVLKMINFNGYVLSNWTGRNYLVPSFHNIFFGPQKANLPLIGYTYRNSSIFSEAPMFSLVLCFSLLVETLLKRNTNKWKIIVLVFTIFTTYSVTGYLFCLILWLIKLRLSKKNNEPIVRLLFLIILPFVILISVVITLNLLREKINSGSGIVRIDDYVICFKAWLINPILGNGIGNGQVIKSFMGLWRYSNMGLSNSITQVLAQGGIYIFVLYIYPFVRGVITSINERNFNRLGAVFLVFYLFCTTLFTYQYLLFIFLIYFSDMDRSVRV